MSKEEDAPARVTRGALRRMSVDQEPTSTPGTPKKATASISTKKTAAVLLDAIQEGSTGPSDVDEDSTSRSTTTKGGKKDASFVGNKSLSQIKEAEVKPLRRTRAASLTEDNVSLLDSVGEARRTPRRRPSQDTALTPQTVPTGTRRKTRRNSATSDDGNTMPATTPKAPSKSRLSVAPPTIAEDDEKEDKANQSGNSSSAAIAEAELSDLDIRKLRNRAISNSPVPRSSPSGKNTSMGSQKPDEGEADTSAVKVSSPAKEAQQEEPNKGQNESTIGEQVLNVSDGSVEKTPTKGDESTNMVVSPVAGSVKRHLKDVTFEESTPMQLDKSVYPKTPVVPTGEKRRKLSEKAEAEMSLVVTTPEVVEAPIQESPQKTDQKIASPKTASPTKATKAGTPEKADQSLDKSIDMSLANIVEDVRENINQEDQSMSILGTPKPLGGKQKSHFSHLREGAFSTPIAKLQEVDEENETVAESPASQPWTQAVKGTSDKGIDVFSVRKQEEEQRQEEQTKQLNESLKRKSLEKKKEVDDEEEEEEEENEDEEDDEDDAPKGSSFVDDEAMEVQGYESGDSLDSETRADMADNEVEDEGESLGSKDSEFDEEEDENDSFIASEDEEFELLDGSGDDLDSEKEDSKSKGKKKHKRIIQQADSSDEEEPSVINLDETNASEVNSPNKTPKKADLDKSKTPKKADLDRSKTPKKADLEKPKSPKKTPAKGTPEVTSSSKTPTKNVPVEEESLNASSSPRKTPAKSTVETTSNMKTPKKTPSKNAPAEEESLNADQPKSPKKTPAKGEPEVTSSSKTPKKTPSKNASVEEEKQEEPSESSEGSSPADHPTSPKKTPAKSSPEATSNTKTPKKTPTNDAHLAESATEQVTDSAEKHSTKTMKTDGSAEKSETPKSRKSLPAPSLLISADFYASAKKSATKRNSIQVLESEKPAEPEEEPAPSTSLVTNPAALALARKNKRLSLGASPAEASKKDKRASLPGKLPVDKELESPLKKKKKRTSADTIPEENGTAELDPVEPMEVDECEEETIVEENPLKKLAAELAKKPKQKPKDLSELDTSAILARCNEIVRSDKEKRKQGATLKQKKKDEKRRQREEEQQEEAAEANESTEQQKKKKKKKKKPINYLLEELGEKKEDQVAKALQRKMAILEAKRERKKAKKAAKLQQQLNKENQQGEGEKKKEGIGAKLEKKAKKDKKAKKEQKVAVEEEPKPVVKRAISAFAMYSAQIEELKQEQADRKKPKSKQLKEKNQQPSVVEEVQASLQATKSKKDKQTKTASESAPASDDSHKETAEKLDSPEKPIKQDHQKKKDKTSSNWLESTSASPSKSVPTSSDEKVKERKSKEVVTEKPSKPVKKKDKSSSNDLSESSDKKKKSDRVDLFAPLKSVVSSNEDELAVLKRSLTEPVTKVVKKQKLSQSNSNPVTVTPTETTPPRKLKALSRLELGFQEEPVTPDHKLLKRNHGFKEEPVTPKTIGFKVSNVLPAGQEVLQQQATMAKKKKTYPNSNRIRPEDVKEPAKGLPQPIWTRSGSFEVEELSEAKSKSTKSKVSSDFVPLNVNGSGSTDFLVKPLGSKKKEHHQTGGASKAHRIDLATVDESVINFKKQAIFGKNAHLREKKTKH